MEAEIRGVSTLLFPYVHFGKYSFHRKLFALEVFIANKTIIKLFFCMKNSTSTAKEPIFSRNISFNAIF